MWNDYSKSYIKNNHASGLSVMVATFISALLLSLLCSLFYNFWKYDIEKIYLEEGKWQSRIVGDMDSEDLALIQNFANVEKVVVNRELSHGLEKVVDIYFEDIRKVIKSTSQIADRLGIESKAITYHNSLLAMYLIRDSQDTAPRMVFPFFLIVTTMSCISLVIIIHNSFAVSMNARIHQFGIFSSIGATPKQIRTCLLQEAAVLSTIPIIMGNLLGIVLSLGIIKGINIIAADVPGRFEAVWGYHPYIFIITLLVTGLTIWISAWIPARRMSRLTPLEAIKNTGELQLKRKQKSSILVYLFGIEGELAGNALKAQKKALRTATLSLTCSFLAFSLSQCFFTLSKISQRMTYFERYQDVWDIMLTVKNMDIENFEGIQSIRELSGVRSSIVYQKAEAKRLIVENEFSQELRKMGGVQNAPERYVSAYDNGWLINTPIIIMDDASFLEYCEQAGASLRLDGAVILNRIQDSNNLNFRQREYFPYINESQATTVLRQAGKEKISAEIPVLSYTQEVPVLKEAYGELDHYVLVHFLPVSLWKEIKEQIGGTETDTYVRVLAREGVTLEELNDLEETAVRLLERNEIQSENRIEEKLINDDMIHGMLLMIGGFCTLLAIIGIGNVFSNTLGFVYQRKREFARYMSIGLTPEGIIKIFCIETLVTAGRPVLITIPITIFAVDFMIKASYLEPKIFIREMPILPIATFILAVFGVVSLAYYFGARKLLHSNLTEILWDDTMM